MLIIQNLFYMDSFLPFLVATPFAISYFTFAIICFIALIVIVLLVRAAYMDVFAVASNVDAVEATTAAATSDLDAVEATTAAATSDLDAVEATLNGKASTSSAKILNFNKKKKEPLAFSRRALRNAIFI